MNALTEDRPVVAIDGKGLTETPFAFELDEHCDDNHSVVTGGMEAWSKHHRVFPIETSNDHFVIRPD